MTKGPGPHEPDHGLNLVRVRSEPEPEPETRPEPESDPELQPEPEPEPEPDPEPEPVAVPERTPEPAAPRDPSRPRPSRRQAALSVALGAVAVVLSLVVGLVVFKVSRSHHGVPQPGPARMADADGCRWWSAPKNAGADRHNVGAPPASRTKRSGTRTMT